MIVLNTYLVPNQLKSELRKPIGKVYASIDKIQVSPEKKLITVGDAVSCVAIKAGLNPSVIVYDGKENRSAVNDEIKNILEKTPHAKVVINNPSSSITEDLQKAVKNCLKTNLKTKIFVIGEEDLAVIPFVIECNENTVVLYGQNGLGIVAVEVDENAKNKCRELLNKMEIKN